MLYNNMKIQNVDVFHVCSKTGYEYTIIYGEKKRMTTADCNNKINTHFKVHNDPLSLLWV